MKKELMELYIDFLISSFERVESTKISKMLGDGYSHDRFTKMLLEDIEIEKELSKKIKPMLREFESELVGAIIVDDTIIKKPYTDENDIVCWHYDHNSGRVEKGIGMLNFLYTNIVGENISIPLGYETISKRVSYSTISDKRVHRKSEFSKNEIMREKLSILNSTLKVKYKYILADSWFASVDNMNFIDNELNKKFIFAIKSNRNVALSESDKIKGNFSKISELDMKGYSSRLVYIKGFSKPLRFIKPISKDRDDGEVTYSYLITNDINLKSDFITTIYQKR